MHFINLHNHDCYSLLDGLGMPEKYVQRAKALNQPAIAQTNHGTCCGFFEFYKQCKKQNVKPILGIELYIVPNYKEQSKQERQHLILLAKNAEGVKNLYRITTESNLNGFYYKPRISIEYVLEHCDNLIALSACVSSYISKPALDGNLTETERRLELLSKHFKENLFLEIMPHNTPDQKKTNLINLELSKKYNIKLVATNDTHYLSDAYQQAHNVLLLIESDSTLSNKKWEFAVNGLYLKSREEMFETFKTHEYLPHLIVNEALDNTLIINDMINIELDYSKPIFPEIAIPKEYSNNYEYIIALIKDGLRKRGIKDLMANDYMKYQKYIERLEYELGIIHDKGFVDYFLIVRDFIQWAKDNDIIVGPARGSCAGSLISYLLNISQLDPMEHNLLFERFLNPERIKSPDIDTDFESDRRDEVKQYIIDKYGQDKVASIGAFSYLTCAVAFKDVARVYEIDPKYANLITKYMSPYKEKGSKEYSTIEETLLKIPEVKLEYDRDNKIKEVFDIAALIQIQPRHTTVTAAGLLITDKPITDYVSLKRNNKDSILITEWDKYMLEEAKFLKMDILGLKTLTVFKECLQRIGKTTEWLFGLKMDDDKVYQVFRSGFTAGVFQFESEGIQDLLKQIKPTCFNDIVAANALYRPGTMKVIESYINRKNGVEKIQYDFPGIEDIVKNTYGKVIYQEQVMSILSRVTGMNLGQADILRKYLENRDVDGKEKFIKQISITNKDNPLLPQIIDYIRNFGGYLFNLSHSASYSVLAYYTAYLKAYYPKEFFTSLLNQYISDKNIMSEYFLEIKRIISINQVDINKCKAKFTFDDKGLNVGLISLKGIGPIVAATIEKNAPYISFDDFEQRNGSAVNSNVSDILIKLGAFDSLEDRQSLLNRFGYQPYDYYSYENEILGYNRVHKLDEYWNRNKDDYFKKLSKISSMPADQEEKFLVELKTIVIKKDKKGKDYALLTLFDGISNATGFLWNYFYDKYYPLLKQGNILIIKGAKNDWGNHITVIEMEDARMK